MRDDEKILDIRAGLTAERERARKVRDQQVERTAKVSRWLSQGGARAMRSGSKGEVFTRHGDKLERESPGGEETQVSAILDPRLKLTDRQRATGNCYGAYSEEAQSSGASEFMREYVDRSIGGSAGASEARLHKIRMVGVAHKALIQQPAIVYPLGRSRGLGAVGSHKPIKPRALIDGICVQGFKLQSMAVDNRWTVERQAGAQQGKPVVPDRQRKHLAEALRVLLDLIYDAWDDHGYSLPFEITRLVVR